MGQQSTIKIYTDGACKGNPGPGGWGVVLEDGESRQFVGGREDLTTNNRMELKAAVEALRLVSGQARVVQVVTDSEYIQKGITEWLPKWKLKSWKTASKKPVKNQDLWRELDALAGRHSVQWLWVKGHSGDPGNELADDVAQRAIHEGGIFEDQDLR